MTEHQRDELLLRLERKVDGHGERLDRIEGALQALLEGQHAIREVMVRDGAAQFRVNQDMAQRLAELERKAG